jgi:hypothetical protein
MSAVEFLLQTVIPSPKLHGILHLKRNPEIPGYPYRKSRSD